MGRYIAKRLLLALPVLWGVSLLVFSMMRIVPGTVVDALLQESTLRESREIIERQLGLNEPFWAQYRTWITGVLRLDLGASFFTREPVLDVLLRAYPVTLELALLGMGLALVIAIPAGVLSATFQDTPIDYAVRLLATIGIAAPSFWVATMLVLLPAIWFGYLPPLTYVPIWEDPLQNLRQYLFPALSLGTALSAATMRFTRAQMLEVLRQDYIRTARAKGLRSFHVLYRHGLKNAMIPVITVVGTQMAFVLGGSVIIESIYGLPGVGRVILQSISRRDYPQIQGGVLLLAVNWIALNLIVDLLYGWLDPRIKYS